MLLFCVSKDCIEVALVSYRMSLFNIRSNFYPALHLLRLPSFIKNKDKYT